MSATYTESQVEHPRRSGRAGSSDRHDDLVPFRESRDSRDSRGDHGFHGGHDFPEDREHTTDRRVRDLLTAQRLASGPNGTRDLLRWLAHRTATHMRIVDRDGVVRHEAAALAETAASAEDMRVHTLVHVTTEDYSIPLGTAGDRGAPPGTLRLVGRTAVPHRACVLLTDTVPLLGWAWNAERSAAERTSAVEATVRGRQAILRLLVGGHTSAAQDVARVVETPLPAVLGVLVVEFPAEQRHGIEQAANRLAAAGVWAWAPLDPARPDHLVLLVPVDSAAPVSAADRVARELVAEFTSVRVGVSGEVPLELTAAGYEQAARAVSAEPGDADRIVGRGARATPAAPFGPAGTAWARRRLAPLRTYRPVRRADPDADELTTTLATWLRLGGRASRRLHVHRNTMAARLKTVAALLDVELDSLAVRAELSLALRISALAGPADGDRPNLPGVGDADLGAATPPGAATFEASTFDEVLALPRIRDWAEKRSRPLVRDFPPKDLATLDTWLASDARIEPTAAALGISGPGVRKRLVRIEERLGTELIGCPATQIDLWLALRVCDRRSAAGETRPTPRP